MRSKVVVLNNVRHAPTRPRRLDTSPIRESRDGNSKLSDTRGLELASRPPTDTGLEDVDQDTIKGRSHVKLQACRRRVIFHVKPVWKDSDLWLILQPWLVVKAAGGDTAGCNPWLIVVSGTGVLW